MPWQQITTTKITKIGGLRVSDPNGEFQPPSRRFFVSLALAAARDLDAFDRLQARSAELGKRGPFPPAAPVSKPSGFLTPDHTSPASCLGVCQSVQHPAGVWTASVPFRTLRAFFWCFCVPVKTLGFFCVFLLEQFFLCVSVPFKTELVFVLCLSKPTAGFWVVSVPVKAECVIRVCSTCFVQRPVPPK